MPIITTEYIVMTLVTLVLLGIIGAIVTSIYTPAVQSPKLRVEVIKSLVSRKGDGIYVDLQVKSSTNAVLCINYIEVTDLASDSIVVFGVTGDGLAEVIELPVCIRPDYVMHISGYHAAPVGFGVGSKVMLRFHYTFNTPQTGPFNYNPGNAQSFIAFTTVVG